MEKAQFNKHFGQFIKLKRKQLGKSQLDVAAQMFSGNAQNISRLERGEVTPTLFWYFQLSTSLETNPSVLLLEFENYLHKLKK
jgi:transcriptional regulator with XRE-family HTH domain